MAKTAGILLIGNEILSGKITDANAAYLCRELRALGVEVRRITVIPDEVDLIAAEVRAFSAAYDVVFTSGGVGPTHDDVTIEGVARALDVPVIREPRLVSVLEGYYKGRLNEARLKMAEVPQGAELTADGQLVFPAVVVRNIYILPGVPEIFRQKFDALKERFRDAPFHLCCVYVSMGEGTLADHLNELLAGHPDLMLGSYPEFSNPEYKVKVTFESKDRTLVERAVEAASRRRRSSGSSGEPPPRRRAAPLTPPLAVAIVAAALFLGRLGAAPFLDPPEGIHAQIAWEMLHGAGWITPHLDGVPYFDKPPLLYWLLAGAFAWLGPTESAARLVSGLSAVAVAVITVLIGTRLASARVGLMAGLMVAANLEMFLFGRMVKPDLLFVACILLGLYGFVLAYLGKGRWPLLLAYGSLGLAVLAKDLLGALGPLAIVALFLGLTGEGRAWRQWIPPRAVLLLLAVAVPWYVAVELQHRGFLWYTIVDNHVLNVTRQRVFPDEDVSLSTVEFLAVTAAGFFPWVLALPLATWRALARPWRTPEARLWALLGIWVVTILGIFALSPFKLPHYGLPAFPAMALLVARLWDDAIERPAGAPRSFTLLVPSLLTVAALAIASLLVWRGVLGVSTGAVALADVSARNMAAQGQPVATDFIAQFRPLFGSISAIFGLVAAAVAMATWRRLPRLGVGAMLAGMLAFLPLSVEGLAIFAKSRSVRVMTDALLLRAAPGDVVAHEGALENSASALLRLDRRVQIVNGLQSNLAFGATFPEARGTFWDGEALARAWRADRRVFLLTALTPAKSVVRELPPGEVHLLLEGGGRRLYSNRP